MADRDLFLDTLREVAEIVRVSGEIVEKDEIRRYFAGMELTDEQEEMVCQYLNKKTESADEDNAEPGSEMSGKAEPGGLESSGDSDGNDTAGSGSSLDHLSDSVFYRMYLKEVREKGSCSEEKMQALYGMLLAGEDVAAQIADGWLMRIIRMAELYKENQVNMQDLIQEGNVALWMALGSITGGMSPADVERYLRDSVREAFEAYISESAGFSEQTKAMLAKAALLHEAQEFLASENGRTPSLRELSEYTHIPVDEIQNILALYEQAKE